MGLGCKYRIKGKKPSLKITTLIKKIDAPLIKKRFFLSELFIEKTLINSISCNIILIFAQEAFFN